MRREDLGAATAHLLPAIAVLVGKLLKVTEPEREDARRVAKLERQLAELRAGAKEAKRALAAVTRERDRLAASKAEGASRAERLLEAAVGALRARPPYGVEPAYVEGFVARNRDALLGIVRVGFGG